MGTAGGGEQFVGRSELGHDAIAHARPRVSRRSRRISNVGMMGSRRTNRNMSAVNSPSVPINVDQSQNVGTNTPHADGRKSWLSEPTTMTNRSIHMPMLISSDTMKRGTTPVRTCLNQSSCATPTLNNNSSQYSQPYGPKARFSTSATSKMSPLYQAMKFSMTYEYATIRPVASMILAITSRWRMVTKSSK